MYNQSFLKNDEQKYKISNNYHHNNFFDRPLSETGVDHMLGDVPSYNNYTFFPREFDTFGEIVSSYPNKTYHNEEFYQDPNPFMNSRNFGMPHDNDEDFRVVDYENNTLQSFMDTQSLLREALTKDTLGYNTNNNNNKGRKDSIDLFF